MVMTNNLMDKNLMEMAEEIATKCNHLVEKAGYDVEEQGIGYDVDGNFYALSGTDMEVGLKRFFEWMFDEIPEEAVDLQEMKDKYNLYLNKRKHGR